MDFTKWHPSSFRTQDPTECTGLEKEFRGQDLCVAWKGSQLNLQNNLPLCIARCIPKSPSEPMNWFSHLPVLFNPSNIVTPSPRIKSSSLLDQISTRVVYEFLEHCRYPPY